MFCCNGSAQDLKWYPDIRTLRELHDPFANVEKQTNTGSCSFHEQTHARLWRREGNRGLQNKGGGGRFRLHSNIDWYSLGGAAVKPSDHCKLMLCGKGATGGGRERRRTRREGKHHGKKYEGWKSRIQSGQWRSQRRGGEEDEIEKPCHDIFALWCWARTEEVEADVRIWLHGGGGVPETRGVSPFSPREM